MKKSSLLALGAAGLGLLAISRLVKGAPPEDDLARIRKVYYNDLKRRGDIWVDAAKRYWDETEGVVDTETLYSIYIRIYDETVAPIPERR